MAVVTAGERYLAIRTVKDLFWTRETPQFCGVEFINNLTSKRNHSKKANGLFVQLEDNNKLATLQSTACDGRNDFSSHYSLSTKNMRIAQLLINELQADPKFIMNEIWKHPKKSFINIIEVKKSLQYLQDIGFSKEAIADSAAVCFYPQENIKKGLEEIKRNESELNKMGFVNGFVQEYSHAFPCGCASKDKRLQLCLYYMELPFSFNGSGLFHLL